MTSRAGERLAIGVRAYDDAREISPRSRAAPWLVAVFACAIAGGAGYSLGRRTTSPPRPVVQEDGQDRDQRIEVLLTGQGDLRNRLIRLEAMVANRATNAPAAAPVATIPAVPEAPSDDEDLPSTPEALAALDAARALVAAAIQNGRWTENDRDRMRHAFGPIGDEGRKTILQELSQAINSGKLSLRGLQGPPL